MTRRIACIRIPPPTGAPPPDAEAGARLAGALLAAAPRVTPVAGNPRAFWADAAGMERRGGEAALARALLRAARDAGWEARVGIAGCCMAAAAAARERGTRARVVPPGRERAYLRQAPLGLLPLPPALRQSLAVLGVERCGALAALEPAEVELRFGAEGVRAWRLARGDDPRWPFRPAAPDAAHAEAGFEPPLEGTEPLRFVLGGLIAQVVARLARRQRIPARLALTLHTEDGGRHPREVRPARPTADLRVLADLCRRAAEEAPLPARLCGVTLEAVEEGAPRADQLDAFALPAPDPGALHAALLPVFARWGDGALSEAARHGAHLPAEHASWVPRGAEGIAAMAARRPPAEGAPEEAAPSFRNVLPLCLRRLGQPLPVTVREDDERHPREVRGTAVAKALPDAGMETFPPGVWKTRSAGPERISGAWWSGGEGREYWRVESPEGWMGLLFREAESGRWYLEGWYD